MAQELIVTSTTSQDWDGRYIMQYDDANSNNDLWKHETKEYFIFRNSWHWMISYSCYYLEGVNLRVQKTYLPASPSPVGTYLDTNDVPITDVEWENFP